jgi:hypothetical protein
MPRLNALTSRRLAQKNLHKYLERLMRRIREDEVFEDTIFFPEKSRMHKTEASARSRTYPAKTPNDCIAVTQSGTGSRKYLRCLSMTKRKDR